MCAFGLGRLPLLFLLAAIFALALAVPGYDFVGQTASEIGEIGSPARWRFTAALVLIGVSLMIFATGVWSVARQRRRGVFGAALVATMGVSVTGVGWFAFPHPLHNTFGESQLVGYVAPLALAIAWRGTRIASISWIAFVLLWASVVVNLSYLGLIGEVFREALRPALEPVYALVQRSLFLIWFGWCALIAVALLQEERRAVGGVLRDRDL